MLSYRHGFHAGNTGDVLKHLVVTALLRAALRKLTPLCYVDTHAGAGEYDLAHEFAARNREFDTGIGALWDARDAQMPALVADYLAAVAATNDADGLRRYPGSPAIARHWLDPNDSMWLAELHPTDNIRLVELFAARSATHVHRRDGYQLLKSVLPPRERRALVLIDPAYEVEGEQARIVAAVSGMLKRMRHVVCAIWAPLRGKVDAERLADAIAALQPDKLLRATLRSHEGDALGSTMLVINPAFRVDVDLVEALAWVTTALPDLDSEVTWLVGGGSLPSP